MAVRAYCRCCEHTIGVFQSGDDIPDFCDRCKGRPDTADKVTAVVLCLIVIVGIVAGCLLR